MDPMNLATPFSDTNQAYVGTTVQRFGQVYKKINFPVTFSGTDATISSIATGAIYFVTLGEQSTADNNVMIVTSRVRYVDN